MLFQKIQRCSKEKVWGKHLMGKSYSILPLPDFFFYFVCPNVMEKKLKMSMWILGAQIDLLLPLASMTPGSHGLTTYKELCSLASDLNQPDLVYKFMNLANHHAMWNSRKVSYSRIVLSVLFPVY